MKRLNKWRKIFTIISLLFALFLHGCGVQEKEPIEKPTLEENEDYGFYFRAMDSDGKRVYKSIFKGISKREEKVEIMPVEKDIFEKAVYSVMFDNPQFLFLSDTFGYDVGKDGKILCYYPEYTLRDDVADAKIKEVETETEKVKRATEGKNDYEKELYIHDYLMKKIEYDSSNGADQTLYGALITGQTNCRGYSAAFAYLLNACGVEAGQVIGSIESNGIKEGHSWNFVVLDERFYYCDECWNDISMEISKTVPYHYSFFNMTLNEISKTHEQDTQKKYLMLLNETNDGTYCYMKKNGLYASNYDSIYAIILEKIPLAKTFKKPLMIQCDNKKDYLKLSDDLKCILRKAASETCLDIEYYECIQVPNGNTVIINFR